MNATHKCKSDKDSTLPMCTWKTANCHSPCDLLAQSPERPQAPMIIETPDGPYPATNREAFWTIARQAGETTRDFVIRTWREAYPIATSGLTLEDLQTLDPEQGSAVVVKEGYASPYTFAGVLRDMVDNDKATILGAYANNAATIYYTWKIGDDGPVLAAFYDPARRESVVTDMTKEIDFFAAVDELSKTPSSGARR